MEKDFVTIMEISKKLGIERSNARKYIIKSGFNFIKVRTEESRHQLTLALPINEANKLYNQRLSEGFNLNN